MRSKRAVLILAIIVLIGGGYAVWRLTRPHVLVLTGIVTTNDVALSAQVPGQIAQMLVKEGDVVRKGQTLAVLDPQELAADTAYYAHSASAMSSQVQEAEAALRMEQRQTADAIAQAESTLASTEAQEKAAAADAENARLVFTRNQSLSGQGVVSSQDLDAARTAWQAAGAKREALERQVQAQRSAVAMARANAEQVAVRQSQLQSSQQNQEAARAQREKADVRLRWTQLQAPIDGIVDVRALRQGEYAGAGQPVLTLVDPDDLWVRVDVEESSIDRVRLGDKLTVRLPSGVEREGTVIFRGVDAGFATQRDVSRTKRDIRTFEVRLRVDNKDRRLAVGMTAYVLLPVS
jgi:HlyD family secretion protein